ncbi:hypothetical protein ElyMa_004462200 [Elysia marginata]|uniref:Uncharacterized protein n=1 Tax=Elysia marginata TaxID=1093978 RepID=A0AAV4HF55_9GAST|nr:hypothetical protein ElyMa_004462200 [Elysia marginata]
MQSESTTLSNYMHPDSKSVEPPLTPTVPPAMAFLQPSHTSMPPIPESPTAEPSRNTNIYRASFVDDMAHKVSHRKSPLTYSSASKDW